MEKTSFNWTNPKQRKKNTRMLNKKLQLMDNMHQKFCLVKFATLVQFKSNNKQVIIFG